MTPRRWSWLGLALVLVSLAGSWLALPEGRIPVHFGADGRADGWGTRTGLVGTFALVAVATWGFLHWLTTKAGTLDWSMVNIPRKDHWTKPENEPAARARLAQDMALTTVWTMVLFAAMGPLMVLAVRHEAESGTMGVVTAVVVTTLIVVLVGLVWWRQRFYRDVD